jgi:hypothetical protein
MVVCYRFKGGQALPLVKTRFLQLANSSPKTARSPARRSRDGRATSGKKSGAISAQRPGNSRVVATAMPPNVRQDGLQDNSQDGAQSARNVLVTVRATADATSCETSRKMTARNSVITISTMTPKNNELITINTQP